MHRSIPLWILLITSFLLMGNPSKCQSTLHEAILSGNMNQLKQLLKQKEIDINLTDSLGYTPLMLAIQQGNPAMVKLVLKKQPDLDRQNYFGETSLMQAVEKGHEAIVKLLLKHKANVHLTDRKGWNALMLCRSFAIGQMLLKHDIDVHYQATGSGITALMIAAEEGNEPMVQLLLQAGANPAMTSNNGITAIGFAERNGHKRIVTLLTETQKKLN